MNHFNKILHKFNKNKSHFPQKLEALINFIILQKFKLLKILIIIKAYNRKFKLTAIN